MTQSNLVLSAEGTEQVATLTASTVRYEFAHATSKLTSLKYRIVKDGTEQLKLDKLGADGRTVAVRVNAGDRIGIQLGADTKPMFRRQVLYEIVADSGVNIVKISERRGKVDLNAWNDDAVGKHAFKVAPDKAGQWQGQLWGDTWALFSPKYTALEAASILEDVGASDEWIALISRVYEDDLDDAGELQYAQLRGTLTGVKRLRIEMVPDDPTTIFWEASAFNNCRENIRGVYMSADPPATVPLIEYIGRASPLCYYAAFKAAVDARIDEVHLSSGWRPMIGSVLHRVGVGLDVNYLLDDGLKMDRVAMSSQNAQDRYRKHVQIDELESMTSRTPEQNEKLAQLRAQVASLEEKSLVTAYRTMLKQSPHIRQLFAPWFMRATNPNVEDRTGDMNRGQSRNEQIHNDHLHITANDPEIY
ncbi:hypothetical protein [Burkholderia cepacia]|uniref:hypothetical protein n=1 Tax=Burkholderia cepacia TaxID=292 RepID=UPI001CF5D454|nr:hypothetical protein [Burkholderia cepacia]MCA8353339.1 hypothetical protein [Burkholderia cepacia]